MSILKTKNFTHKMFLFLISIFAAVNGITFAIFDFFSLIEFIFSDDFFSIKSMAFFFPLDPNPFHYHQC